MRARLVVAPALLFALACGGASPEIAPPPTAVAPAAPIAPAAPAEPEFGSVAFQSYQWNGHYVKFRTDTAIDYRWDNMTCKTVTGTYTQNNKEVIVKLDPSECTTQVELRFRQVAPCSMAMYTYVRNDGVVKDQDSSMYARTEPRCPRNGG